MTSDPRSDHSLLCVDKFPVHKFSDENHSADEALEKSVDKFWNLDCLGIMDDEANSVYDTFRGDLKFNDSEKRYEVGLPWKLDPVKAGLPDNLEACKKQLISNIRSMKKTPEKRQVLAEYHKIISSQFDQKIVEEIDPKDEKTRELIHYLPHRAVVQEKKRNTSSWVRIVYNGSFKREKNVPSLNECLLKGPSLNPLIIEILIRFRIHPVAFVCDIKKAFLQIMIKEDQRDLLRFLWVDDPLKDDPNIIKYRFCRVLFGLSSSPFLLNGTLREHFRKHIELNPMADVIVSLLLSLFVDDFAGGGSDCDDVFGKFMKLVEILSDANFQVHKFFSNSTPLVNKVQIWTDNFSNLTKNPGNPNENLNNPVENLEHASSTENSIPNFPKLVKTVHEVLGVPWDFVNDNLIINLGKIVENESAVTKRCVLRTIAKIYDPLGVCSPVGLKGKLMFQELCRRNLHWDDNLSEDLLKPWNDWTCDLVSEGNFTIPRCYESREIVRSSLVGFADGSSRAYACVVYVRNELEDGEVTTMLVSSKARVAPLEKLGKIKKFTVPRLELLGCYVLSKLMETVTNSMEAIGVKISEKRFYADATISLGRIKNTLKELPQWEGNRVNKIREITDINDWYYVPTEHNASDLPSRGCSLSYLKSSEMWKYGPEFIRKKNIPIFEYEHSAIPKDLCLVTVEKIDTKSTGYLPKDYFKGLKEKPRLSEIIDISKYSGLNKLLRVTAYVYKYVHQLKAAAVKKSVPEDDVAENFDSENLDIELTAEEILYVKRSWIISEQSKFAQSKRENFLRTGNNL